jgi:hydroxymethylbilane synthase
MKKLRIATRQSKLALWQANHVKKLLLQQHPELEIELVGITTKGDKILDKKLADIGGKGLFIKELEVALLTGQADIAVHSMKDVPPEIPEGLQLGAILKRNDPRDAFISKTFDCFSELPKGAVVGTCSVRRQSQLLHHRPDLKIKSLRGNVDTRLAKLEAGEFDAIILAAAGLKRLQLEKHITEIFSEEFLVPSVAQGAIGIECRKDNTDILKLIAPLNDLTTEICIDTERRLVQWLNGNCHSPIGSYATLENNQLTLTGLVASSDGQHVLRHQAMASCEDSALLAEKMAAELCHQGAKKYLD